MSQRIVVFGATGATGSHLVKQALGAGSVVRAFVRSPEKVPAELRSNPLLEIVQGDLSDLAAIDKAIAGADIVVSVAGNARASRAGLMTAFVAQAVLSMRKHGAKRLLFQAGAFSNLPGEKLPLTLGLMRPLIGAMTGLSAMFADNEAVIAYLLKNAPDLNWTVTRPGMLQEGPLKALPVGAFAPGTPLSFVDLAAFTLATAQSQNFIHECPYPTYGTTSVTPSRGKR